MELHKTLQLLGGYLFWLEKALVVKVMGIESHHLIIDERLIFGPNEILAELHATLSGLDEIIAQLGYEEMKAFHDSLRSTFWMVEREATFETNMPMALEMWNSAAIDIGNVE